MEPATRTPLHGRTGESIPVKPDDPFTARMFEALNAMMLDMLAAIARKDYDDRRRRQMQGIAKAKPTANIVAGPSFG